MKIVRPFNVTDNGGFSRASTATYYDKDGVLQTAAIDEPRWQWDPATGEFDRLLIEAESQNLLAYSDQFSNAAWAKSDATVTANAVLAPDGTISGDKLVEAVVNGNHYTYQNKVPNLSTYTHSVFAKAGERTILRMNCGFVGGGGYYFDLATGTVLNATAAAFGGRIESVGSGWYRCSYQVTATAKTAGQVQVMPAIASPDPTSTYSGDGTSGLYIWGAQLETGDDATSYIQTASAAVTRAADVLTAVMLSNVAEADYAAWSAATTYALGDYVIKAATHRIYRSLQAGNLNHDPAAEVDPANPVWWLDTGATNRWRMFDELVGSQTGAADVIGAVLTASERVDSVVLLGADCQSVRITMTDDDDGVVFDQAYSMISDSGIADWYAYFFEPIVRKSELAVAGLPPYVGARVLVALVDKGGTAKCGECIVGLSRELGGTQYGARVGIRDYSVKSQDDFGNYSVLERAFSRRGTYTLWVEGSMTTELHKLVAQYRATPVAWIGADAIDATIIYGFYRDFDVDIAYPDASICSLEIEGLT